MKILILQLARLGDIFLTAPAISAIKRAYPQAEIHYLSRQKFSAAAKCLENIDKHYEMPTADIIQSLLQQNPNLEDAVTGLENFLNPIKNENYDWIINYSFSPLSSYIVHYLSDASCRISGYTRHTDGYFNILDEVSAYFYAQVGIQRANRVHLADMFAAMVGVELTAEDWYLATDVELKDFNLPNDYIVVHVGASEEHKSIPGFKWARIIKYFGDIDQQSQVVLIGAGSEMAIAHEIQSTVKNKNIINLVGSTTVAELFPIIRQAKLLVGCDSAPIHVASLTQTPALNISFNSVNFWETGPRSNHSKVYLVDGVENIKSEVVAQIMTKMLNQEDVEDVISAINSVPSYNLQTASTFSWELIQAIYFGEKFPVLNDLNHYNGMLRLYEVNQVIIENLSAVNQFKDDTLTKIINRGDEIMTAIAKLEPQLQVLVRWVETEKLRVGPGSRNEIVSEYLRVHNNLSKVLRIYLLEEDLTKKVD